MIQLHQAGEVIKKITNRQWSTLGLVLGVFLFPLCISAQGQPTAKVYRIGYLSGGSALDVARIEALGQGLRELGYVEGKNIVIERRSADGKLDRLAALAAELVRLKVDVIVTAGLGTTGPAHAATGTIPIVMTQDQDPVSNGFVASLARPGGNITGLSTLAPEVSGKRLELLSEMLPKLSRVAVLGTSTSPSTAQALRETELAAAASAVNLHYLDVRTPKDVESAFRAARKGRAEAVLVLGGPVLASQRSQFADLAVNSRLPAIYWRSDIVEDGGLMSYGVNLLDLDRRAATYVHKILKGAKPGDLPVERPNKFELVINLRAAKQIGLTIPPTILARADRVIR
jgi:putative tryptophan/tyrosine transport system substrate-binding protein